MASDSRVSLRPFVMNDSAAVHRWFNNARATKMLLERRDSFSVPDAEDWTHRAIDESGDDRKFAIVEEDHDYPVGLTALYGLLRQTAPELEILIGDRVAGVDVGRRAEALTIARAFQDFGAHKVYGRIAARNRAAKWAVASLGWRHEATLRGNLRRVGGSGDDNCEIWGVLPQEFFKVVAHLRRA